MLKLKLWYFGYLMLRADSLGKTLILGKIEDNRKRGRQRISWLHSTTNSMDMNLSKLQEIAKDRGVWHAAVHGVAKSRTQLSDWTTTGSNTSLLIKVGTIINNTVLPMRNVCLFLWHKNSCFGIQPTLGKLFLPPVGCLSVFSSKSCQGAWRSGLGKGQVNMADEEKLRSPICSTFEALILRRGVGSCCGEELGPFWWPVPAAGVAVYGESHGLAERTSQMFTGIQKAALAWQLTTKQWPWPLWGARLALGSPLELLLPTTELVVAGCHKIHFLSYVTIQLRTRLLLLCR